jgi:peptidoglycan/LPS O-acetylase OafA/YrhL
VDDPVRRDRSPGIDCLRGLFAFWVVFGHVIPWALYVNGTDNALTDANAWFIRTFESHYTSPPVLGFIVLSGYCIHRNGLRRGTFDLRAYRTRRIFRIVPVYLLGCAVGVALLLLGSDPAQHALTGTTDITLGGLVAKLTAISAIVPSTFQPSFQGNAPLVTVAAEMRLHAFYALMVNRPRALIAVVGVAWIGGIAWTSRHPEYVNWWHIGSLPGFLPYWWLGALFVKRDFILRRRPVLLLAAALAFAILTVLFADTASLWLIEARKVAFAALVGGAVAGIDGVHHRVLAAGNLVGRASYSLYALHAPIIIALLVAGVPWTLTVVIAVAVALISFAVVERPLMRKGARLAREGGPVLPSLGRRSPYVRVDEGHQSVSDQPEDDQQQRAPQPERA